jgi:hypothetical protein
MSKFLEIFDAVNEIDALLELREIPELEAKFKALIPSIEQLLADVRSTTEDRTRPD